MVTKRWWWFVLAGFGVAIAAHSGSLATAQSPAIPGATRPLDPYYPGRSTAKLTTPQWVGEPGVECVVTLGIDDMRDPARYESFLRPILERLKQIDGRAPVSVMTCQVNPRDPLLARWLEEGLSLEVHTVDHPCPCLQGGDFEKARGTYERCVDLLHEVPGNRPVAFRMPCCDSLNTPSPRFWAEIFARTTASGNFLQIDTSVFNIVTPEDAELPAEIRLDERGESRFRRYVPFDSFVNTIQDYPYPYVIGRTCWEFPCVVPSDWSAQHVQKANNPDTVRDLKLALDAAVLKQGTFNLVFHPHGWIRNDQIVELIDHAVAKHGRKVKFLTFRECLARLNEHLLAGQPLRDSRGLDNGVTLVDLNRDGFQDVVIENSGLRRTRRWDPQAKLWVDANYQEWAGQAEAGLPLHGLRLAADLDGDAVDEIVVQQAATTQVFRRANASAPFEPLPFGLPAGLLPFDAKGRDAGLRLRDVDGDRLADVVFSDGERIAVYLLKDLATGWGVKSFDGPRTGAGAAALSVPPIVRPDGSNNGAFFHSGKLWFQNEDTQRLPNHVDRVALSELAQPAKAEQIRDGQLTPPKTPEEALRSMTLRPGWKIELVASEPLLEDPVAFDWAPDGSLWVAEMRDYPNGINWAKPGDPVGKPGGRVKRLIDQNGDGKYDVAQLFLDDLPFPTGVKAWRDGVLVSTAPDLFFAKDTNGDGRADTRETILSGFREGNQQHRVNGMRWGFDNWLYLANGDSGGLIRSARGGGERNISGRDLRFRPDTGEIDLQSGQTQFGRNRDDWGNWFGGNNANPMWHYVLEDHYLRRNPHVGSPDIRRHVSVQPGASPVFPTSVTLARFNDFNMSNRFTSACSPEVYRDQWPEGERFGDVAHVFICEPVHNLVHHEVMIPSGWSFSSQRPADEQNREFLASSDNWFRPVMVRTGPDGAIWVCDMYRAVIEHPEWIPVDWQRKLNLRAGADRGRIYRVSPSDWRADDAAHRVPQLAGLSDKQLVERLGSANGWVRDTAQQMLLWKWSGQARSSERDAVVSALDELAQRMESPAGRLHALWTLEGLGALQVGLVVKRLDDPHSGVRRQAVRLAERFLHAPTSELLAALRRRLADQDRQVVLQLACSLGEGTDPECAKLLAELAKRYPEEPLFLAAVWSSLRRENVAIVLTEMLRGADRAPPRELIEPVLSTAAAMQERKAMGEALQRLARPLDGAYASWQWSALAGLLEALGRQKLELAAVSDEATRALVQQAIGSARGVADDLERPQADRLAALRLVGLEPARLDDDRQLLARRLTPRETQEVQSVAVAALNRLGDERAVAAQLAGWRSHSPAIRAQILDGLLGRENATRQLLAALERGEVPAAQLDARRRQQLMAHRSEAIRAAATKIFSAATNANRQEVVERYGAALRELKGEPARGKVVFEKRCANCHRLGGAGHAVGPDLAASSGKGVDALLMAIFDPNRAIEDRYLDYLVITDDGRQLGGLLAAETGASITLLGQEAKSATVLRSQIDELRSTGKSLMPEGLERDLTPAEVADLLAYVRQQAPPPKKFDGNEPAVVRGDDGGALRLLATTARIYGPSLVFEPQYRNLGYWSHADDNAVWSLEVPRAGSYQVSLDYACHAGAAGSSFVIEVAGKTVGGQVESTGTWDIYRTKSVGVVELPAGATELTMRAAGPIASAMIDLRGVRLIPVK